MSRLGVLGVQGADRWNKGQKWMIAPSVGMGSHVLRVQSITIIIIMIITTQKQVTHQLRTLETSRSPAIYRERWHRLDPLWPPQAPKLYVVDYLPESGSIILPLNQWTRFVSLWPFMTPYCVELDERSLQPSTVAHKNQRISQSKSEQEKQN